MKTILLTMSFCLLLAYDVLAQVFVDGVNVNDRDITYCQLITGSAGLSGGTFVYIDYGQRSPLAKRPVVAGPDRQPIRFNSVMDALNFMIRNGWELVSWQVTSDEDGDSDEFIYLLRKRN